ncbi:MAG: thiamine pyrophosphate-binding protein [Betaproteobacteria bacterium]
MAEPSTAHRKKKRRRGTGTHTTSIVRAQPAIERPVVGASPTMRFGSDAVAEALRSLDIPYIAINPGASFRGLHDSLVNYLGNARPQILLCLHEEHAVAIAHGYAKVTGRAMAAAAHSNVGLFHATMAVFNAWCDRMPLLLIGATGPVDASHRRPWIEWIHTARDQGAIVRDYVKWDDQPASPAAARESILRAAWLAETAPQAPVYINLDVGLQESPLAEPLPPCDASRYRPRVAVGASAQQIDELAKLLRKAKRPVFLVGRVSRREDAWDARVRLAEACGARVVTDLKVGAAFPTLHPLHVAEPGIYVVPKAREVIAGADLVVSFDWVDLAGTLGAAFGAGDPRATIVQISQDHVLHNGWSMDHQGLPAVDHMLAADPDEVALALAAALDASKKRGAIAKRSSHAAPQGPTLKSGAITMAHLAAGLREAVGARDTSLVHLPLGWNGAFWPFRHPLDFLGSDGGGGVGGGPGISVGAALALRGSGRLAVCIGGDGDFLMGATAMWTAAHYRIPLLVVVANNRSFFNDEVHQERVARMRGRPVENKWIGQRIDDPPVDIAGLARAQGALGIGAIESADALVAAFREAIAHVDAGGVAVVDVITEPGYTPAMVAALNHAKESGK